MARSIGVSAALVCVSIATDAAAPDGVAAAATAAPGSGGAVRAASPSGGGEAGSKGARRGAEAGGGLALPPECSMSFGESAPAGPGAVRLSGYVDIQCGDTRIQADTVVYDTKTKLGTAEGNVVMDWSESHLAGSRMEFDLSNRTGTLEEATGFIEPEIVIQAKRMKKLDEEHVLIEKGIFTSCTQPIPYWSFRVGRGLFHLRHYAHLRNIRMNVGRLPVFYLPWMLWPIKGDRAAGLLFPSWGNSRKYGFFIGDAFFVPIGRSADLTVEADYYRLGGLAEGFEANWLPNDRGYLRLQGHYLDDTEHDEKRWMGRLDAHQSFGNGWRLGADLNKISDFNYFQDFAGTLAISSASYLQSNVNLTRNGESVSLNLHLKSYEQFFTNGSALARFLSGDLTQDTVPEIELRGRSQRLPGTPLYFSYLTSADWFHRDFITYDTIGETATRDNASWGRIDIEPLFSMPLRPMPWLSLETRAALHETYYTAYTERSSQRDPTQPSDPLVEQNIDHGAINRHFFQLDEELIGPSFYRVFESSSAFSPAYKHVIEPRLVYTYVPGIDVQNRVPIIDEKDPVTPDLNLVTFTLTNRLLAKRPTQISTILQKPPTPTSSAGSLPWSSFPTPVVTPPPAPQAPVSPEEPQAPGEGTLPAPPMSPAPPVSPASPPGAIAAVPEAGGTTSTPSSPPAGGTSTQPSVGAPAAVGAAAALAEANPVEILSLDISESYSFGNALSTRPAVCPDGSLPPCAGGAAPSIPETRHFGPLTLAIHFNPTVSASVDFRSSYDLLNHVLTSSSISGWYRWGSGYVNSTWFRTTPVGVLDADSSQIRAGSGAFLFNRKLTLDGDLGYDLRRSAVTDERGRIGYYTQCCGFLVEYLRRDFEGNQRREIRFSLDLKGIGHLGLGGFVQ